MTEEMITINFQLKNKANSGDNCSCANYGKLCTMCLTFLARAEEDWYAMGYSDGSQDHDNTYICFHIEDRKLEEKWERELEELIRTMQSFPNTRLAQQQLKRKLP